MGGALVLFLKQDWFDFRRQQTRDGQFTLAAEMRTDIRCNGFNAYDSDCLAATSKSTLSHHVCIGPRSNRRIKEERKTGDSLQIKKA